MENEFHQSCEARDIAGVALLAADTLGRLNYTRCFGVRSLDSGATAVPMSVDTIMRIASSSKLITSIACMQAVERGLLRLDADVAPLLPEVGRMRILTGFDSNGLPIECERTKPLTLRHLLSHSSGLCYDAMHPLLMKYRAYQGVTIQPSGDKIEDRFTYPLVYEPGDGWTYGPNLEWAGRLLERATGNLQTLEEWMQENICKPLGITDMTFQLQARPDLIARRSDMHERTEVDGVIQVTDEGYWHHDPIDAMGGMGIFTSPASYMKVMRSLLANDSKLLLPQSVDLMFAPQLSTQSVQFLMDLYDIKEMNSKMGALLPPRVRKDHALGGMLITEHLEGWRSTNTLTWSGLPNVFWSIDRTAGICLLFASQLKPPGDERSIELARLFERTMYSRMQK